MNVKVKAGLITAGIFGAGSGIIALFLFNPIWLLGAGCGVGIITGTVFAYRGILQELQRKPGSPERRRDRYPY
jgi:O-antigen/teichoic acid export membrane protein